MSCPLWLCNDSSVETFTHVHFCFVFSPLFLADSDFASFSLPLVFHPLPGSLNNQRVCRNLSLLEDDIFEDQESLSVVMEVSHPRVSIHIGRATVFIQDNDEVSLSFLSPAATVPEDVGQVEACVELQGSTEVAVEYSVATLSASAQGMCVYM